MDKERLQLLEDALHALLETLQPTQQMDQARRLVVADMQKLVAEALPAEVHCSVETFGSYRAGLHLPGSDLDFALAGWVLDAEQQQSELHDWNGLEQQCLLEDLADQLEEHHLVQGQVERVLHARVPVIKFTHHATGLACDVSINRPECTFKADMQKLLGSLDRRYATLYRLIKAWAAAHGLNDAAANTFNSWSLGLMVAFYLQCGIRPAVLPPIWQLLEKEAPDPRQPRVLQLPNINSAALKRVLNQAATGAGAYLSRRMRAKPDAVNSQSIGELLSGFFEFYAPTLLDWCEGRNSCWRASTWWGEWKEAAWYPAKSYLFSIEDPFNAGDNTARAVGTRNSLASCSTAAYIAATFNVSAQHLKRTLGSSSSSNGSTAAPQCDVLAAFAWLFGPHAVLQLPGLPPVLSQQLKQQVPGALCDELQQQLEALQNCVELLSASSSLINRNNSSIGTDPARAELIQTALGLYRQLMQGLGCQQHHVCLGDFVKERRELEQQQAEQRERERQERLRLQEEWQRQQLQAQQQQQQPQLPEVVAAMQGLGLGAASKQSKQQQQQGSRSQRPSVQRQLQHSQSGGSSSRPSQHMAELNGTNSSGSSSRSKGHSSRRQASAPPDLIHHQQQQPVLQQQQQEQPLQQQQQQRQLSSQRRQQQQQQPLPQQRQQQPQRQQQQGRQGERHASAAAVGEKLGVSRQRTTVAGAAAAAVAAAKAAARSSNEGRRYAAESGSTAEAAGARLAASALSGLVARKGPAKSHTSNGYTGGSSSSVM